MIGNDQVDTDAIDYDGVEGGVIKRVVIHDFLGDNSDAIDIGEQAVGVLIDSVLVYDLTSNSPLLTSRGAQYMPQRPDIQPVISEICYAPDAAVGETEYVMISNVSTDDINLSGYSFTHGFDFTFPEGVSLPAGESLYVVRETNEVNTDYPQVRWTSGRLANEGETIELTAPSGIIVDQVRYLPTTPWPVLRPEQPNVIALKNVLKDNHIASNWEQKKEKEVNGILDIADEEIIPQRVYDLLGKPTRSVRGITIIKGKKRLKK